MAHKQNKKMKKTFYVRLSENYVLRLLPEHYLEKKDFILFGINDGGGGFKKAISLDQAHEDEDEARKGKIASVIEEDDIQYSLEEYMEYKDDMVAKICDIKREHLEFHAPRLEFKKRNRNIGIDGLISDEEILYDNIPRGRVVVRLEEDGFGITYEKYQNNVIDFKH
jgi:hypothetical protein